MLCGRKRSFRGKDVIHAGLVMTVNGYGCLDEHTVYYETATIEGDTPQEHEYNEHRGKGVHGAVARFRPMRPLLLNREAAERDMGSLLEKIAS